MQRNYDNAVTLGSKFLLNDTEAVKGGMNITYDKCAGRFIKVVEALKLRAEHRPHDPRTTFITMAKRANVDEYVIKILTGHKITDITEGIYTKRDFEWLKEELLKMP